jgi:hypothetical protein
MAAIDVGANQIHGTPQRKARTPSHQDLDTLHIMTPEVSFVDHIAASFGSCVRPSSTESSGIILKQVGISMESRYILAGASHTVALGMPNSPPSVTASLTLMTGHDNRVMGLTGASPKTSNFWNNYWESLVANAENATVLLIWNGNQHLARFLLEIGSPFDFYLAARPNEAIEAGATIVPESLVRETLESYNAELHPLLAKLNNVPGCKTLVLGTPPPKGNDERLRKLLSKERHFVNAAQQLGITLDKVPFTRPAVRRKLWLLVQELLRGAAQKATCEFIPVPCEALDESGFLREELWSEDATHANKRYGDLFWNKLFSPGSNVV